jgi:uncharacterized RDD family membrane protein YckC
MDDIQSRSPTTTYELASIGNRFIALLIDDVILLVVSVIVGMVLLPFLTDLFSLLLGIALNAAYYWYFWTQRDGQTPGKRAVNIRVIKADGTPISDADALLRVFGYYVGRITLGLGYLWAVFDMNHQAWHDKMANTYVVVASADQARKTIEI